MFNKSISFSVFLWYLCFFSSIQTRQRRLSGKKVRGILMDLLRGCGDCRSSNGTNLSKNEQQTKEAPYTVNGPPQIKITSPSVAPTPSGSTQCNER